MSKRNDAKIVQLKTPKAAAGGTGSSGGGRLLFDEACVKLLIDAGVITEQQFDRSNKLEERRLNRLQKRGHAPTEELTPLSMVLFQAGYVDSWELAAACRAYGLVHNDQIRRDLAVKCLRLACEERRDINLILAEETSGKVLSLTRNDSSD